MGIWSHPVICTNHSHSDSDSVDPSSSMYVHHSMHERFPSLTNCRTLVLIAKKAHTILTLSALHDRIMTRYYKFLIVNVLVFFCVGTAALQSFFVSFKSTSGQKLLEDVSDSFPTAGPFYVGWRKWTRVWTVKMLYWGFLLVIFTMAMHGGIELALCTSSVVPFILRPLSWLLSSVGVGWIL